ncbi:hypothetical protein, partial [Burkholderia mallei]|uniref:hypothetical protein n=1 Tax=Burkholderia mallei TaxID=13373 RepID=UPI001E5471DF
MGDLGRHGEWRGKAAPCGENAMIRRAGAHSAAAVSFLHVVAASPARCTASRTAGIPPEKTGRPAWRETPVHSYVINSKNFHLQKLN